MNKVHNSGINIFGVIPLSQFSKRAQAGDTCVRGTPNSSLALNLVCKFLIVLINCCPKAIARAIVSTSKDRLQANSHGAKSGK